MGANSIVYVQGHKVNDRTRQILHAANALLTLKSNGGETSDMRILQGSYNTSVSASGGTHSGGGAVDVSAYNHDNRVKVLRKLGCAAWYRPAISGLWGAHVHFIVDGDDTASSAAKDQVRDYKAGRNGLANNGPDDGYNMAVFPKFLYNGSKRRRIVRLARSIGFWQPVADDAYKVGSHERGFVWPETNLCKVTVDGVQWLVSRDGTFYRESQHLTRPAGYVPDVGVYECIKAPAYARENASLSAPRYETKAYQVGDTFTGLGYVDRPDGRFILDYRGAWFAGSSWQKPLAPAA